MRELRERTAEEWREAMGCPPVTSLDGSIGPKGRLAVLALDSASWVEVWKSAAGKVRAEYHRPTRESSVGYVDKPRVQVGKVAAAVRRVLEETAHDPDVVARRLLARAPGLDV